jgi:hypothetical protein
VIEEVIGQCKTLDDLFRACRNYSLDKAIEIELDYLKRHPIVYDGPPLKCEHDKLALSEKCAACGLRAPSRANPMYTSVTEGRGKKINPDWLLAQRPWWEDLTRSQQLRLGINVGAISGR